MRCAGKRALLIRLASKSDIHWVVRTVWETNRGTRFHASKDMRKHVPPLGHWRGIEQLRPKRNKICFTMAAVFA